MTERYRPKHLSQLTGSRCQGSNCWGAVGATAVDAASGGSKTPTPDGFRERAGGGSGRPSPVTGCGTGLVADWMKGLAAYGITAWYRKLVATPDARKVFSNKENAGYFLIETDYELWPQAQKCKAPDFDGNHACGVIPGIDKRGRVLVMNPICADWQKVDLDAVLAAMEKYSLGKGLPAGHVRYVRVRRPAVIPPDPCAPVREELASALARVQELEETLTQARSEMTEIISMIDNALTQS